MVQKLGWTPTCPIRTQPQAVCAQAAARILTSLFDGSSMEQVTTDFSPWDTAFRWVTFTGAAKKSFPAYEQIDKKQRERK